MLTLKQVVELSGKSKPTLLKWLKNEEFKRFIHFDGIRKYYNRTIVDFLKTYKPERKKRKQEEKCRAGGSICWICKTNPNECMWMRFGIPIKGWTAKVSKIRYKINKEGYIVQKCPCFRKR